MEEVKALATKILDECRVRIQANMAKRYRTSNGERWVDASGRSSDAFKVEEVRDGVVALKYEGDDVAPLESIQYGNEEPPTLEEAERWRRDKISSGAKTIPSARAIVRGIEKRGGTERKFEHQEWIIGPEVEAAVDALNDQLPEAAAAAVRNMLFGAKL